MTKRAFTEEHKRNLSLARKASPALRRHLENLHAQIRGKPLAHGPDAWSSSMASKRLKLMGLSRKQNIELWKAFKLHYMQQLVQRRDGEVA